MLETLARLVAAEILVVAAVGCAYGLARRWVPDASVALRCVAAGTIGLWLAVVLFHGLAAVGAFRLALVLPVAIVAAAWIVWTGRLPQPLGLPSREAIFPRTLRAWLAIIACVCGVDIVLRGLLVPVVAWDSMTYHAVKAGMWVQSGGYESFSAPGSFGIYRAYPGNGEILHAWAMLPLRGDLLVGLADAASWLLLGLAFWALAQELGVDVAGRAIGVAYLLAVPAVARAVGSAYVDTTLAACLVSACALLVHGRAARSAAALALAFAALGVACGVKLTALPVAAGVGVLVVVVATRKGSGPRRTVWLIAGAVAFLGAAAPWYVRAWHLTGHPFSPVPLRAGPLVLGEPNDAMRWYLERPELATAGLEHELRAAARMVGIPGFVPLSEPTLGMLTPVVVGLGIAGLVSLARRQGSSALILGAMALLVSAPYFGAGLRATRLIWPGVSGRYLIAALAVLLAASLTIGPSVGWQRGYRFLLGAAATAYLLLSDFAGWTWYESVTAVGAALLLWLAAAWLRGASARGRIAAAIVLPLLSGLALAAYRDITRESALRASVVLHPSPRYWLPAARIADDPPAPQRIAVTAGPAHDADNWLCYPFLGRRLQNELVYVPPTADGTTIDPSRRAELRSAASYPAWVERLAAAGVDAVMSFSPASLELAWMEQHPEAFERLAGDGRHWGFYGRRPPP